MYHWDGKCSYQWGGAAILLLGLRATLPYVAAGSQFYKLCTFVTKPFLVNQELESEANFYLNVQLRKRKHFPRKWTRCNRCTFMRMTGERIKNFLCPPSCIHACNEWKSDQKNKCLIFLPRENKIHIFKLP